MNAINALERSEFDPRIHEDLSNPPPQTVAFTDAFRRFAEQIVSKRRQEEEMASAAAIQRSLLPAAGVLEPVADLLDLDATMRPAREVGGDFYDYFLLDARRVAFFLGDVCGKGLPASLFAATVVTALRTTIREEPRLETAVARANAILCRDNAASMFATAFIGVLDLESGDLAYCNCGHNPPLIVDDGALTQLPATGIPLAMIDTASASERRVRLEKARKLIVYSDGVTEALNPREEEYGEERLAQTAVALAGMGANEAVPRILAEVDSFAEGAEQSDDITCIVLERRGARERS